ncbi:MAG: phosphate ABC transporter, permease protein PstA, partial [Gallionella sp.]
MPEPQKAARIRALIRRLKFNDHVFSLIGLVCMMVGVVTLLALFTDLLMDGMERLNYEFFTSFPSRRAAHAGILSAWVGTLLVMSVTALVAIPMG